MHKMKNKIVARSEYIYDILKKEYPNTKTELNHSSSFQLLIATILSAQCTDKRVNIVTPAFFKKYPTPDLLAQANIDDVLYLLKSVNYYKTKSLNLIETAKTIQCTFSGKVPDSRDKLMQLSGVGRKTANVLLGQAFNIQAITIDTHVSRLSKRLGFTEEDNPLKIEFDLMNLWPEKNWVSYSNILIQHGRTTCKAANPKCHDCLIHNYCVHPHTILIIQP
jgi:endonuclease III